MLGTPANEIVAPILAMSYLAQGSLRELALPELHGLLLANGWNGVTAVCMVVFTLLHWPCATTLLTVYRETKSLKWTALAFVLPTACGMGICFVDCRGGPASAGCENMKKGASTRHGSRRGGAFCRNGIRKGRIT